MKTNALAALLAAALMAFISSPVFATGEGCFCRALENAENCRMIGGWGECDILSPLCLSYCSVAGNTGLCSFLEGEGLCNNPNYPCTFDSCEPEAQPTCLGIGNEGDCNDELGGGGPPYVNICEWHCACSGQDQPCTVSDSNCCEGLTCNPIGEGDDGICSSPPPPLCAHLGEACTSIPCCGAEGLVCENGICAPAPPMPDLAPHSPQPAVQRVGAPFTIQVATSNIGQAGSPAAPETVTRVDFGSQSADIPVRPLGSGESDSGRATLRCETPGTQVLQLRADAGRAANEANEANNLAEYEVECRPAQELCSTFDPGSVQNMALIGIFATVVFIVLVYFAGTVQSNSRLLMWSKAELVQAGISVLLLALIAWILATACTVTPGEIIRIFFGGGP